ncbi:MAG: hypothetical protein ACTS6A_01065 [Candidatus Hodgkinia cicadicola]
MVLNSFPNESLPSCTNVVTHLAKINFVHSHLTKLTCSASKFNFHRFNDFGFDWLVSLTNSFTRFQLKLLPSAVALVFNTFRLRSIKTLNAPKRKTRTTLRANYVTSFKILSTELHKFGSRFKPFRLLLCVPFGIALR